MTVIRAISDPHAMNKKDSAEVELALCIDPPETVYFRVKRLCDCLAAAVLLVLALPVVAALIVLIRITSQGPGIYAQSRVGRGGTVFTMYKLRSMRSDAEAVSGPVWSNATQDTRVTPLGYWLRALHLDELPQLFNVLQGHMALVGPRPERPEFVKVLIQKLPKYAERLHVAPGITGLAQINLPPDTDLNSVRRKLLLDCEYITSANVLLDLRILAATGLRLFGLRGGRATRWLGVQRVVELTDRDFALDAEALSLAGETAVLQTCTPQISHFNAESDELHKPHTEDSEHAVKSGCGRPAVPLT
jgi:lipopolysaccharide/colanic/teichoic acid biosynthesis glycosyltransferase